MNKHRFSIISLSLVFTFTIQATKYYISPIGNDLNKGTITNPFKSISMGASLAQPGDTVSVLEGTYRERVSPPRGGIAGKPIVYMGEPNKNVIIKGSDVWTPTWNKQATAVYYAQPDEAMFNDDCYVDNKNPFKVASSSTPYSRQGKAEVYFGYAGDTTLIYTLGQVFVDGYLYIQKPFLSEMNATVKTWCYDRKTGNLYIHFADDFPAKHVVEISTRRRIFAPHKRQLSYITVQGFVMEHCGNQYPANFWEAKHPEWQQAGALGTRSGKYWVIKNNMVRFANGPGIDFGQEGNADVDMETGSNGRASGGTNHIIDSNYICDNGAGGVVAYGPYNITFTNNVIERNVNLMFYGSKRWESAGVKMHGAKNTLVAHNLFRNNYGEWTLYFDGGAGPGTRVHGNLIIGGNKVPGLKGFDMELAAPAQDNVLFDNNILINQEYGISLRNSGGVTAMHNLILGSTVMGIFDLIDKARAGCKSDFQYYFNNVLLNCKGVVSALPPNIYNVAPYYYTSSDRRFDNNLFQATTTNRKFKLESVDSLTFSTWQNYWKGYNGNINSDLNSRLSTASTYSVNTSALTMQLNVCTGYANATSYPYGRMDSDYLGNPLNNNGSALPGPFQKLQSGLNQINLWSGLPPLDVYKYPYASTSQLTSEHGIESESMGLVINYKAVDKKLQLCYKSTSNLSIVHVSVANLFGKRLLYKSFRSDSKAVFKAEIDVAGLSSDVYIVTVTTGFGVVSKKVYLGI